MTDRTSDPRRGAAGGVCAAGDVAGAKAGADVLAEGGTAADAVIAAVLAAAVTLPTMTGLGGGAVFLVHDESGTRVLDAFADVPGRGASDLDPPAAIPVTLPFGDIGVTYFFGPGTVAVPGLVSGLFALHERCGRLPFARLACPAAELARHGCDVGEAHERMFAMVAPFYAGDPACFALIGDEGGTFVAGRRRSNPPLADTIGALALEGERFVRDGPYAQDLIDATEGLVTRDDLAAYRVAWREPIRETYRGRTVIAPAAPSIAGVQTLAALAAFERGGPLSPEPSPSDVWRLAEALQRAERLRDATFDVRREDATFLRACIAACRGGSTVHVVAADREGRVVGCTSSLGEGSGVVVPGTGVLLNNFLGEPDIAPADRRAARGTRMMTSMSPTLVVHRAADGGGVVGLGAAGSSRIRSAIPQVVLNHLDRGLDLAAAIAAPRIHVEDGTLHVEGHGRTEGEIEALLAWPGGNSLANRPLSFFFGGVQAVSFDGRSFDAGADVARRGGAVAFADAAP